MGETGSAGVAAIEGNTGSEGGAGQGEGESFGREFCARPSTQRGEASPGASRLEELAWVRTSHGSGQVVGPDKAWAASEECYAVLSSSCYRDDGAVKVAALVPSPTLPGWAIGRGAPRVAVPAHGSLWESDMATVRCLDPASESTLAACRQRPGGRGVGGWTEAKAEEEADGDDGMDAAGEGAGVRFT